MIQQVTIQMTSARTYVLEGNKKCDQLNPKELMLLAGVTCAGMTAMAIMEKERVSPTRFELSISGELDTETVQSSSVFKSFRIVYNVQCECENDQMKVSRAINLAHDKHCGGVQMLRNRDGQYEIGRSTTNYEKATKGLCRNESSRHSP